MYIYIYVLIGILFSGLSFSRLKRVKIAKSDTRSTIMVLCMASMCVVLYFFWFGNSSWIEKKVGEWCGGGEGTQTTKFVCVCVWKKCSGTFLESCCSFFRPCSFTFYYVSFLHTVA